MRLIFPLDWLPLAAAILCGGLAAQLCAAEPAKLGYAPVNGLQLYYEIYGTANGKPPLVLLHGGGSTIETSWGKYIPELAKTRQVIAFEQQGHGRTADIAERPFTFEQSADDTAELLKYLNVPQADLWGYSNGGNIAMQTAIRHPQLARKLVIMSSMFTCDGLYPQLLESLKSASSPDTMPAELREAYLKVAPHPEQLPTFFRKSVDRMLQFKDWKPEDLQSIQAASLVLIGDADVIRPEHAVQMFRLLPHAHLAVLPGVDHMAIVKRDDVVLPIVTPFLDSPIPEPKK